MKRMILFFIVFAACALTLVPSQSKAASSAIQSLPSIPACTMAQLDEIMLLLQGTTIDIDSMNEALDEFDLDLAFSSAMELHRNWFEDSPNMPYCAQGVHTRLLVDRAIEAMVISVLALRANELDIADEYIELITLSSQDLITYGEILSTYE